MKDRDATEGSARPFGMVHFELGEDGLEEGANEGDLKGGSGDGTLVDNVLDCEWWL